MENVSEFDLNKALRCWLEALAQSPHFRKENVAELESHIRDSVGQLQTHGLSAEESFLIATRRVGCVEKLEGEFAKVNPNPLNKLAHALVLVFFSLGCWLLWGLLHLPLMTAPTLAEVQMPAFTVLLVGLKTYLVAPPLLALVYCLFVWSGKFGSRSSWIGFFALTAGVLILFALPTIVAVLLPVINLLNRMPPAQFQ